MLPPDEEEGLGWHPAPEFWSANRAEHRFADGHELIAFDLPAAHNQVQRRGAEECHRDPGSGLAQSFGPMGVSKE